MKASIYGTEVISIPQNGDLHFPNPVFWKSELEVLKEKINLYLSAYV
jgi:hypothetical protein